MPVRTLGPKGGGFGAGPTSIGEMNECQRGRWAPKGGWIVMSHIGWGGEQKHPLKGCGNLPLADAF